MTARPLAVAAVTALLLGGCAAGPDRTAATAATPVAVPAKPVAGGVLPGGAAWKVEVPPNWNGTLLLWSRGYGAARSEEVEVAPRGTRDLLLANGYGLVASSYSKTGWALAEAVPDQVQALDAAIAAVGKPRRVIAWGSSMGGLVTVALAERHGDRLDAALPYCGSIGGAVGMMNMALDGAFAFTTLVAPGEGIDIVRVADDRAVGAKVQAALDRAQATPGGRARVALAGVLAGLPLWSDPKAPEPAPADHAAQQAEIAKALVRGVFFPRQDQEQRSGGLYSWNTGVDYRRQLDRSGHRDLVEALYRPAGLDLDADLDRLAKAPRIAADPKATAYMMDNYVPSGRISIPVLAYHEIGDGLTSVRLQGAYAQTVKAAGRDRLLRTAYVRRAGHCQFTPAEHLAALRTMEHRLDTGRWDASAAAMNARAKGIADGKSDFVDYTPLPLLRQCRPGKGNCP